MYSWERVPEIRSIKQSVQPKSRTYNISICDLEDSVDLYVTNCHV